MKKKSWKKRIGFFYGISMLLTILFTKNELNKIIKSEESMFFKEKIASTNTECNEIPKEIKINEILVENDIAEADEFDKRVEEYLKLLETLDKTQEEYTKMRENLFKIKEKLNISPYEDTLYADKISIGDEIILVDELVPAYMTNEDLLLGINYKTSYYGIKEIRLVSKIIMAKDYTTTEVDNMEDYELFKSMGYSVIGYNTLNQYSLGENGRLIEEGKYETEGVLLVFKEKETTRIRIPKPDSLPC